MSQKPNRDLACVILAVFAMLAPPAFAQAGPSLELSVPAQPMETTLRHLAEKHKVQFVYSPAVVRGVSAPELKGTYTLEQAMQRLTSGTRLAYSFNGKDTVVIREPGPADRGGQAENPTVLAQAANAERQDRAVRGEAITVTAQKRSEQLLDVPVPVTSLRTDVLLESNQLLIRDYYTKVPGLIVSPTRQQNFLAIRGITSGGPTNPTVGVTIDDMPYGSSTNLGGGAFVPDFDPGDLARIEVLRGPQGALYGAGSMGGLLKFVTVDPSTKAFSGRAEGGLSTVRNGEELGYNVRSSVNVPLGDTLAIRASAFHRRDPGYVDNVKTGEQAVNTVEANGGRLSALWRPSGKLSIKLGALIQELEDHGSYDVDVPTTGFAQTTGLGDLQQYRLPGTGGNTRKAQAYTAVVEADLGFGDFVAVTGYNDAKELDYFDFGFQVGALVSPLFGVSSAVLVNRVHTKKFSQEARINLPIGTNLEFLLGAFYTKEKALLTQDIWPADPNTGVMLGDWSAGTFPTRYEEYAAFGTLTLRVNERLDIQAGGRQGWITTASDVQVQAGPRFPNRLVLTPAIESKAEVFTYLLTPRYKVTPDTMVYGRFASGYRAGGPNGGAVVALGLVPPSYAPDKTNSYEIGFKSEMFDRRFAVDASVYYIDWKDIQLTLQNVQTGQFYTGNASRARSQGVEIWTELRPATGTTINGWVAFSDAELKETFPPGLAVGFPGDRLPLSPRWSGNLGLNQEFPLGRAIGILGATFAYVGDRIGLFRGTSGGVRLPRQDYPSYTRLDLRAGLKIDRWSANFFMNNATDKRGVLNGGAGTQPPFGFQYIQPRTVGVTVSKTF